MGLKIDENKYSLPDDNYYHDANKKKQIILGHSGRKDMSHYDSWLYRYNGKYKKGAAFTIDVNGEIFKHYDPKFYTDFIGLKKFDERSIPIMLVNEGWLWKDVKKNKYYNALNEEYINNDDIYQRKWRGQDYWAIYNEKQMNSLIDLVIYLCDKFNIKNNVIAHNTKVENIGNFEGVVYRSNFYKEMTDLSPAWYFDDFRNKINNKLVRNE